MAVGDLIDERRSEPPLDVDEWSMLEGWLDYHRTTLVLKCQGLSDTQLVATSRLSLLGLIRHMSEVELYWTSTVFCGNPASYYVNDVHPEADFEDLKLGSSAASLHLLEMQIRKSNEVIGLASLDQVSNDVNNPVSLRWILTHLMEEYSLPTVMPISFERWLMVPWGAEASERRIQGSRASLVTW